MVWNGQHFLGLEDLSKEDIQSLIQRASHFLEAGNRYEPNAPLSGKIIANLFMENSTLFIERKSVRSEVESFNYEIFTTDQQCDIF